MILVLESSTVSAKAMMYDIRKGVLGIEQKSYPLEIGGQGRLDAHRVFLETLELGKKLVDAHGNDVAAVSICGVWHSILACDKRMNPVSPACLWTNTAADSICRKIRNDKELSVRIYRATGCMPNITYQPYSILYLKQNGLDLRDKYFASQAGYNFFQMTGERLETRNIVSGMGLLNIHGLRYDAGIMELCGIRPDQLGSLVDYKEFRPLNPAAAARLGISSGIPVVPPHADGSLNHLGNNAMQSGRMTFSVGTSAAIRLSTDRPVLSDPPATWCYVGVENRIAGAATNGACNCVNWFKETFLQNRWSFAELESTLLETEETPVFLPFLFGERCPGWNDNRRGGFCALKGTESVADLFRAITEGILLNVFQCYEILAAIAGTPEKIILSGGILNSKKWTQMAADIFQRELIVSRESHASLLGGVALGLHAAGELNHLGDFVDDSSETVVPRPETAESYRIKFRRYLDYYRNEKQTPSPD